jgi:hypothetical protein
MCPSDRLPAAICSDFSPDIQNDKSDENHKKIDPSTKTKKLGGPGPN